MGKFFLYKVVLQFTAIQLLLVMTPTVSIVHFQMDNNVVKDILKFDINI